MGLFSPFSSSPSDEITGQRRRGKKLPLFLVGFLILAMLGWFAPAIAAGMGLLPRIIAFVVPELAGRVTIESASLGWFSPVNLSGFTLRKTDGTPILSAQKVSLEKNLCGLISDSQQLGRITIASPQADIQVRPGGSDLEDSLAELQFARESGPPISMTLIVQTATVLAKDDLGRAYQISDINGEITLPSQRDLPANFAFVATVTEPASAATGMLSLEGELVSEPVSAGGPHKLAVKWQAEQLPCGMAALGARRFQIDLAAAGTVTSSGAYTLSGARHDIDLANLQGNLLNFSAPAYIGKDALRFASATARGKATLAANRLYMQGVDITCDFGGCTLDGAIPLAILKDPEPLKKLAEEDLQIKGNLDIARLAAVLPSVLRVRPGTEITRGALSWDISSRRQPQQHVWNAQISASDLQAINNGEPVSWPEPVQIQLAAHQTGGVALLDQLVCRSSFLQATAQGSAQSGQLKAAANLDELMARLDQFFDLGSLRLAGTMTSETGWKLGLSGAEMTGNLNLANFACIQEGKLPWEEQQLNVTFLATGSAENNRLKQIDRASVLVQSAADKLDLQLTAPVAVIHSTSEEAGLLSRLHVGELPLRVVATGRLASWLARLQMFLPSHPYRADGQLQIVAEATATQQEIVLKTAQADLRGLQVRGGGLFIVEPTCKFELAGRYDHRSKTAAASFIDLTSSTVAVRAEPLRLLLAEPGPQLEGDVGFRADVARLQEWVTDPSQPAQGIRLAGNILGAAKLAQQAKQTKAEFTCDLNDLVVSQVIPASTGVARAASVHRAQPQLEEVWREPHVALAANLSYDAARDALSMQHVDASTAGIHAAAAGTVEELRGRCYTNLKGTLDYDWEALVRRLPPLTRTQVRIAGRRSDPFSLQGPLKPGAASSGENGPLISPELTAAASIGWDGANLSGMQVGAAVIAAELKQSLVSFAPINIPLSGGRLTASPRIELATTPRLVLQPGPLFQQVELSPALCSSWLKFVAPLLADATATQGTFSLQLAKAEAPLFDFGGANLEGTFQVHKGTVGPGPLANQFLVLAQQIEGIVRGQPLALLGDVNQPRSQWLVLPEQQTPFRMAGRVIEHNNFNVWVKDDVLITTRGKVAVDDDSLALVADVPVQDNWLVKNPNLAGLKGTKLQVPITGTLKQPKLDSSAVSNLVKNTAARAAGGLLDRELKKGLDKLFGPLPAP